MRNLNVHRLQKSLNALCDALDKLYNVNNGGCCYVAYLISKWLDIFGIKYKLVIYDDHIKDSFNISYEVQNMCKNTITYYSVSGNACCIHYCILIVGGGYVNRYDTKGLRKYVISNISHKNIGWIYRKGRWNREYKTRNNKVVKNMVNSFFKNYER